MRDSWQLFEGVLPLDFCNQIIESSMKYPEHNAVTYNNKLDHRSSTIRWIDQELSLKKILIDYVTEANANAFWFDIMNQISELQFTEYHATQQGKYDWHHDINWIADQPYDRKLSMSVQLSDPNSYDGGVFEFSEVANPEGFKTQGSILVFPSYLQHRVTTVTSGVRYSLVSWVRGPRWR